MNSRYASGTQEEQLQEKGGEVLCLCSEVANPYANTNREPLTPEKSKMEDSLCTAETTSHPASAFLFPR